MLSKFTRWALSLDHMHLERTPCVNNLLGKRECEVLMRKTIPLFDLRGLPYIKNPKVENILDESFNNIYGGIRVFVAPTGSGKTTYMRKFSNDFISNGGYVQYFASELTTRKQFFDAFGGDQRSDDLFSVIPSKSVIILDQIENLGSISDEMRSLVRHLALESRRLPGINVIISTSDISVANTVLRLNGNDKIRVHGSSDDFKWTDEMVDEFIVHAESFNKWNVRDKAKLKDLAVIASCPGFLYLVADMCHNGYPSNDDILRERANEFASSWNEFRSAGF